jgi:pyruvate-formate lyase
LQDNFHPYEGDGSFLEGPTEATKALWAQLQELCCEELKKGVLDVDPHKPSSITAFGPGYIEKEKEVIVGLQTDAPLKRAIKPLGGINMVKAALQVDVSALVWSGSLLCWCSCCFRIVVLVLETRVMDAYSSCRLLGLAWPCC